MAPDPGHRPTPVPDRQVAAALYLGYVFEAQEFVGRVRQLPLERQGQISGFFKCAARQLLLAGQDQAVAGAPAVANLPSELEELRRLGGREAPSRKMFLRQLAGEMLVVGRSIRAVAERDTANVELMVRRQEQSLRLLSAALGVERASVWQRGLTEISPRLFERLLPDC